ncbi:hypothetical protein E7744_00730 [Citricoccus sp. SGAir0253]|nr:hypothetical protein E7744_00730 [Citricoccus sp. SGAir0253]
MDRIARPSAAFSRWPAATAAATAKGSAAAGAGLEAAGAEGATAAGAAGATAGGWSAVTASAGAGRVVSGAVCAMDAFRRAAGRGSGLERRSSQCAAEYSTVLNGVQEDDGTARRRDSVRLRGRGERPVKPGWRRTLHWSA